MPVTDNSKQRGRNMTDMNLPTHILEFLKENFPTDDNLAGYVICIANRDKTLNVIQGFDSSEVRDKVAKELSEHMAFWEGPK